MSKGPISFSIKTKDTKKPKIEYRTSVIYKQSCEQGESDEDADEGSEDKVMERNGADGTKSGENSKMESTSNHQQQETSDQTPADDFKQQIDSIKAAERIGMEPAF